MKLRDITDLVTVGALFGASFLFVRIAVPEFGAAALIEVRVLLAALVLMPLVAMRRQLGEIRANIGSIALMGVLHYALPFCLFAYSMLTLSAGYSSLINASSPIFAALVARAWMGERLGASSAIGLAIGLIGVTMIVWDKLTVGDGPVALAIAAAVGGALCYGLAAVLAKRQLAGVSPIAVAGGSMSVAAVVLLPASFLLWPAVPPTAAAWSMAGALGVICTALVFVIYFRLIAAVGPSKAITVTFLIPVFAVIFGVVSIGEEVTVTMIAGGAVIAVGTALATGLGEVGTLLAKTRAFAGRAAVVLIAIAALDDTPPDLHAAELDTPVYLAANTFSYKGEQGWDTFRTLALSGEVELVSADQERVVSLFAEYHGADDARVDGTMFAGILAGYRHNRWDVTGYWFASRFPGSASRQTFKARFRGVLGEGSKFGIEYRAYADDPDGGELVLGYYRTFNSTLSLKFLAGTVIGSRSTPLAQFGLTWQLR